jgi:hypothetical protein
MKIKDNSAELTCWKQIGASHFSAGNYQEVQISMQLKKVLKISMQVTIRGVQISMQVTEVLKLLHGK